MNIYIPVVSEFIQAVTNVTHRQQLLHHAATLRTPNICYVAATMRKIQFVVMVTFSPEILEAYSIYIQTMWNEYVGDMGVQIPDLQQWGYARDRDTVSLMLKLRAKLRKIVSTIQRPLPNASYIRPAIIAYVRLNIR